MPFVCEFYAPAKLVYTIGYGTITFLELCQHFEELSQDSRYDRPMNKIVRYAHNQVVQLSLEESRSLPAVKKRYHRYFVGERSAMIAPTDLEFGLARMHMSYTDEAGVETRPVRTLTEALAWLELDPSADSALAAWLEDVETRVVKPIMAATVRNNSTDRAG
ncbi:hypothetical protein [Actomonas aquatica]|uniref:WYL domain-containing protein n=1 Tax=Actomonas aquatica TaxID=2866162 RepID=A0ABZ1C7X8_9BACT|nr:hypothetical protein [Opitutus sp. WL0086]WRQ87806.1 hypothetical protein K1X11_000190 [Opitutus sp. WL0086]